MNDVWMALSAVAGLVLALLAVWRIVVRATTTLRDEFRDEIRILRENDLSHLGERIEGAVARMTRVEERMLGRLTHSEERMLERLTRSEERTTASLDLLGDRIGRSEERMLERLTRSEERTTASLDLLGDRIGRSEERMLERLTRSEERTTASLDLLSDRIGRSEERSATSFRKLEADLEETRTELLAAIGDLSPVPETAPPP